EEYVELTAKLYAKQASKNQPAMDAAAIRKLQLSCAVYYSPKDPSAFLREALSSKALQALHKQVDPFYVSAPERAAAVNFPGGVAADIDQVLSDNIETYLAARRKLLAHGPVCLAPVADRARKLPEDSPLRFRLGEIMNQFETQADAERIIRMAEAAI